MEKRVWKLFLRLLVDFRQFLASQHGLNFGLKMALDALLAATLGPHGAQRRPGGLEALIGCPPGPLGEHFWWFSTLVSHAFRVIFLFVFACVFAFGLCFSGLWSLRFFEFGNPRSLKPWVAAGGREAIRIFDRDVQHVTFATCYLCFSHESRRQAIFLDVCFFVEPQISSGIWFFSQKAKISWFVLKNGNWNLKKQNFNF